MMKPAYAQATGLLTLTIASFFSAQSAAQTPEQDRERYREACIAQVEATTPHLSPRLKGVRVGSCMNIAVSDAKSAQARERGAQADAEAAQARAEAAQARAIRQEMEKPAPDLAVLRAHLKTLEQDGNPNAETKDLTDALRVYIQLAAQRKAK